MGRAEAKIEDYLIARVKALGGETRKVVYQGRKGAPDRMCVLPGGHIVFVECKRPGEKPDARQQEELAWLQRMGCHAISVDSKEKIDAVFALHSGMERSRVERDVRGSARWD